MSPDEMELLILGIFYRCEKYDVDRAGNSTLAGTDPFSGLPTSANSLAPRGLWVRGTELALNVYVSPKRIAPAIIWRTTGGEERPLSGIAPHAWTSDEAEVVSHLERVAKIAAMKLIQKGLATDRVPIGMDGESHVRDDGTAFEIKVTYKGLQEARQRVRGTRYDRRGPSVWDTMSAEARARTTAQWARTPD